MSAGRQLRRLVIAPAAVSVVAASLSVVGQTGASAASTGQSQSGTVRGIHLNHQTSTFPAAGPTASGPTKLQPGTGRQPVVDRSMSPRPTVKRTSDGGTALAGPNTSWVPTVSPTTVHSAQGLTTDRMMVDLDTRSLTTGKDLYYVAISRARFEVTIYTNSRAELPAAISREGVKTAALDIRRERGVPSSTIRQVTAVLDELEGCK